MEQDKSTKKNKERKIREIEQTKKKMKAFCFRLVKTLTEIT